MLLKSTLAAWLGLAVTQVVALPAEDMSSFAQFQQDSGLALSLLNFKAYAEAMQLVIKNKVPGCTIDKVKIRREWRTLSTADRKSYIAAVKCMQAKPSLFPAGQIPGSFSLFDDFVAVHLNQTPFIHLTATFLSWHRYFTLAYEQRLNACGYAGALPYWEWGNDVSDPTRSPVFDGSDTSLGGDGAPIPGGHPGYMLAPPFREPTPQNVVTLKPGNGGGCVTKGPFAGLQVHLGPVAMPQFGSLNFTSAANPLADNPRCLKRDLNRDSASRFCSFRNTTGLILTSPDVERFQAYMQADPRYTIGELGVHGGGHYTIGGDPGADPFISPGDPAFYLHHGQIDRVWWIWQMLDFPNRQTVWGTGTLLDFPPSPNVTLDDTLDLSPILGLVPIRKLMSTVGGDPAVPMCYVYL